MRKLAIVLMSCVVLMLAASPARAITYGQDDGNLHPNVGALIAEWRQEGQKDQLCTGTLISSTVFLTAAHCTAFLEAEGISEVWVTFDSEFTSRSKLIPGTMHTFAGYNQRQSDPGDISVVTFAKPVRGVAPARLPSGGLLDRMRAAGTIDDRPYTAVGYGVHEPTVGGGPPEFESRDVREYALSSYSALNDAWLRLSQNAATGDAGTCYGDSGGPNFIGDSDVIAAITVTGDAMCLSTNTTYRVDTPRARAFLGEFVTLP